MDTKLNLTKTTQQSNLKNGTMCGLMHWIYYLKNSNATSDTFDTDAQMIAALRSVKSNATCSEVANCSGNACR